MLIGYPDFPFMDATNASLGRRKPIFGKGVNDAPYIVAPLIDGKHIKCKLYGMWYNMLARCLGKKKSLWYEDASVHDEWLSFMRFRNWVTSQEFEGLALDKDLLIPGNRIYSKDTCLLVSQDVNSFLTERGRMRGDHLIGVSFSNSHGKFTSFCGGLKRKKRNLGYFQDEKSAHLKWWEEKKKQAVELASKQPEVVAKALINRYSGPSPYIENSEG